MDQVIKALQVNAALLNALAKIYRIDESQTIFRVNGIGTFSIGEALDLADDVIEQMKRAA